MGESLDVSSRTDQPFNNLASSRPINNEQNLMANRQGRMINKMRKGENGLKKNKSEQKKSEKHEKIHKTDKERPKKVHLN
jgi:hypothetical protein